MIQDSSVAVAKGKQIPIAAFTESLKFTTGMAL